MGKRSRKRGDVEASATSRAERDAARQRRAAAVARESTAAPRRRPGKTSFEDRPAAPWGSFPLVEIVVLIGIVLMVAGFFVQGQRGATMIVGGLPLASLAGLELVIREHFAGFRSHTTLLAGAAGILVMTVFAFAAGPSNASRGIALALGAAVFAVMFRYLRQAFRRRSGGLSFR